MGAGRVGIFPICNKSGLFVRVRPSLGMAISHGMLSNWLGLFQEASEVLSQKICFKVAFSEFQEAPKGAAKERSAVRLCGRSKQKGLKESQALSGMCVGGRG